MQPHSRGGPTDVINGQALCPACNLKKGSKVSELRAWQHDALVRLDHTTGDFLVVAAPGAGKTTFALTAARRLIDRGEIQRIVVVVPTKHLRAQWAIAAAAVGIQLDHRFVNGSGALARDFDGAVVTYQAVASEPLLYRKLAAAGTLVILDEIHHGGDEQRWGEAVKTAFEVALRRILLSGTPTRTDRAPVPFVHYDDRGMFVADAGRGYSYDYGTAIQDHAVRPIEFLVLSGGVRWREAGSVVSVDLADVSDEAVANALNAALNPDGDWIKSVLRRADEELTRHRREVTDAGGLVVAADQYKARRYASMLRSITGEEPVLAISDEPDSSDRIKEFSQGTARWIVAVQMISEGVDIPRLAVGVYASNYKTELFFKQVAGRFVRMRAADDQTTATLLIPSVEPLLSYAQRIEKTVNAALQQEEEKIQREIKERGEGQLLFDLVEPLDSSEAVHHSTILAGEAYTDEELRRAQGYIDLVRMNASAAQVAHLLRIIGTSRPVGTVTLSPAATAKSMPLADEKADLRRLINRKVGRLNRLTEAPHSRIHAQLNRICDDTADTATAETLNKRLVILDRWIEQA
jgi:superfamily II DNA or RNA helicase